MNTNKRMNTNKEVNRIYALSILSLACARLALSNVSAEDVTWALARLHAQSALQHIDTKDEAALIGVSADLHEEMQRQIREGNTTCIVKPRPN